VLTSATFLAHFIAIVLPLFLTTNKLLNYVNYLKFLPYPSISLVYTQLKDLKVTFLPLSFFLSITPHLCLITAFLHSNIIRARACNKIWAIRFLV